jgi:hypothetical protein
MLELQIRQWERYSKMAERANAGEDEAPAQPVAQSKPDQTPLTTEQLSAKVREMSEKQSEASGEQELGKTEVLDATSNSVRVVVSRTFASLKELAGQNLWSWGPSLLMAEDARFEIDSNQQFRVTFTPSKGMERYLKTAAKEWKSAKMKFQWKLMLPGRILSSDFPQTEQNATWLSLDGEKPESIEAVAKLLGKPLVITAEPGGLKLEGPLEAGKLVRTARGRSGNEPDVPIVDAGPGFVAEPVSVTLSTVYYFPEGEKQAKEAGPLASMFGSEFPGAVVSAKLFPPKGRIIRSVTGMRVKQAKDNQGRLIPPPAGTTEESADNSTFSEFHSGSDDPQRAVAAHVDLHLGLPAPDAQTIDELQAEAIVLTIGSWKDLTLTNVQADAKKEIDLGELVPGAKVVLKKVKAKNMQTTVDARLEGPAAVNQIEVKIKLTGQNSSSNMSERQSVTAGGKTTRNITVSGYDFEMARMGQSKSNAPVTLLIRYPQDVKRERVQFKLTALDLL